jgi:RNA recognition motif-containing protein
MGKMLYVGNLAYAVTNKALEALFSKAGIYESASVVVDRDTGQSPDLVEMSSHPEAQKAILRPNGQELKGRAIKVNEPHPSSEVLHMLLKVSCVRCRLSALWTDDPEGFLSATCNHPRRCEALLSGEDFSSLHSRSTVTPASRHSSAASSGVLPITGSDPSHAAHASY